MQLVFDSYRLDTANQTLHGAAGEVPLMPKTYALLRYLAENPGRLVSKNELLDAVWPRVCVSDTVLKVSVRDLRRALGDDAQAPRYVETLHRRGYRFITAVSTHQAPALAQACAPHDTPAPAPLVGREAELARLDGVLQQALAGARQLLFVSGEPGIGKTALIDAFLTRAVRHPHLFVMRGQCVEPYGEQEAYAPVFDALGGLCRGADRKRWVDLLRCFAPTWFAQMPWLIEAGEREALAQSILGATQERMLRELAELLAACAAEQPLVMILEDLHWSDRATVDLLSYLARRRESARLLLLVSCRPVELIVRDHPLKKLKQDLHMHRQCTELALPMLSPAAVADYLAARFPDHRFPPTLAPAVHRRSDGNPLFMVNMIDLLLARALLCERSGHWRLDTEFGEADIGVPESLRQLIEKQIDQLRPEERRILAAASVAGMEFAAAAVAAMLDDEVIVVEACCRRLARQGSFLRALGLDETTNRASTERFAFIHVLYHDVLYQGLGITYRAQLHRRMGEHAEAAHSARAHVIAAELARPFRAGPRLSAHGVLSTPGGGQR
ncbi:MAG: AAA family ATPase [Gammaproteobacteria bacterium]